MRPAGHLLLTQPDSFTRQIDGTSLPDWKKALGIAGDSKKQDGCEEWSDGEGRILLLAQDPWVMQGWTEPGKVQLIRGLQAKFGGGMDEPIWRFRLDERTVQK